jgi:hypothetical protein
VKLKFPTFNAGIITAAATPLSSDGNTLFRPPQQTPIRIEASLGTSRHGAHSDQRALLQEFSPIHDSS